MHDPVKQPPVRLKVLLVQLPVPNNPATNTPLAAGYLKAYAQAQGVDGVLADVTILPRHLADHAGDALLVQAISAWAPDVLGFSLYTWNSERSLEIARRVRGHLPHVVVVGGGPEVHPDTTWLWQQPGLDIGVIGEGEQTFVELLQRLHATREPVQLADIAGLAFHHGDRLVVTDSRAALPDLAVVPSPYLSGCLKLQPDSMVLIEVTRWCPYACSFCLYGRNMGAKLGQRHFGLERVLAEITWARQQGATALHFVEANLNLVPFSGSLLQALADLNADRSLSLYAELRAEHLNETVVSALDRAGLRMAEVGLQTANPPALAASRRKTSLGRWAAGTRRLLAHNIEVLLDVILGLPMDDAGGVDTTLRFIEQEQLGHYDVFMLQVLPGTAVRRQAAQYGIDYQERPPYYVRRTDRLSFDELRQLRHTLKQRAGLDPDEIDGLPQPRRDALRTDHPPTNTPPGTPVRRVELHPHTRVPVEQLGHHVDLVAAAADLPAISAWMQHAIRANPSTLFDLYLICDTPPAPASVRDWRAALPHQPGYLDRLALYQPDAHAGKPVSPRVWLVLPWHVQAEPRAYAPEAQIIWHWDEDLAETEAAPLGAWRAAGGAGVWVPAATQPQADQWQAASGVSVWWSRSFSDR